MISHRSQAQCGIGLALLRDVLNAPRTRRVCQRVAHRLPHNAATATRPVPAAAAPRCRWVVQFRHAGRKGLLQALR